MSSESLLPFTVQQISGGLETYSEYGERATQILSLASPEDVSIALAEVKGDFSDYSETVFLLLLDDLLVGFSSYKQMYVCPEQDEEQKHFSWTPSQWSENQRLTASGRWTAIHPDFQHRGGWSHMMDALDSSLHQSQYLYQVRDVSKANHYAEKIRSRYTDQIVFEKDTGRFGQHTYFRIRIPRE